MNGTAANQMLRILLIPVLLVSAGCFSPALPVNPDCVHADFHSVALLDMPPASYKLLESVPEGRSSGAGRGADRGIASLWKSCSKFFPPGGTGGPYDPVAVVGGAIVLLCVAMTPFVGIGSALQGVYDAPPADDVERVKRSIREILPDDTETTAILEKILLEPPEAIEGRAFRREPAYITRKADQAPDYRSLAEKGFDAVLEVYDLIVVLDAEDVTSGTNPINISLKSQFSVNACATMRVISVQDNAVLSNHTWCSVAREPHGLDLWSEKQWSLLKIKTVERLEYVGQFIYDTTFRPEATYGVWIGKCGRKSLSPVKASVMPPN